MVAIEDEYRGDNELPTIISDLRPSLAGPGVFLQDETAQINSFDQPVCR